MVGKALPLLMADSGSVLSILAVLSPPGVTPAHCTAGCGLKICQVPERNIKLKRECLETVG